MTDHNKLKETIHLLLDNAVSNGCDLSKEKVEFTIDELLKYYLTAHNPKFSELDNAKITEHVNSWKEMRKTNG